MVPAALLPAIALIAGAAGGIGLEGPWRFLLVLLPALAGGATLAWCVGHARASLAMTVLACGCAGCILGSDARRQAIDTPLRLALDREFGGFRVDAPMLPGVNGAVSARILLTEDASFDDDLTTLRGRVTAVRLHDAWRTTDGGVVLSVGGSQRRLRVDEWQRGRTIEAPVTFRRPPRYMDAGVADFERDAALDGVSLLGSIKSGLLVEIVQRGGLAEEAAADVRSRIRRAIAEHVGRHSGLSAAIVSAVLIGDRSGIPDNVRIRLQAAGTYHVIAISGGNIGIFTALVFVMLAPLGFSGRSAASIALSLLFAYAFVVTAGPSVWRATLVAATYLISRLMDHRTAPWQAMAVAGGWLAVLQPLDVRNAGFVLTFGATAALLTVAARNVRSHRGWLAWPIASVVASAAVEIVLLPVMAGTFSRVTMAGLVLNLIAVPAMAVVQVAGMVVACAGTSDAIGGGAGWLAHCGAAAIVESARLVDVVPWLVIRVPPPSIILVTAYYAGVALALLYRGVHRHAGVACTVVCGFVIVVGPPARETVNGLRLTMFDVGQGDAMVVQVAGGHSLMVDSGGSPFGGGGFDIGSQVIEPALWGRGIASLEQMLLTHGDPDHIGGAIALIDDFRPHAIWQGIPVSRAGSLQRVLAQAGASGIPVEQRRQGETLRLGAARVLVLHPPTPDWERPRVRNDDSVVLEILYGDVALLLTGDIGSDVERTIVARLAPAKLRILKVAHHGSRTSTSQELLDAWRPQVALISAGRGNSFGHPAPEVIARLEANGVRVYRTDRDGEITIDTDGRSVGLRTFVGDKQ